ncbi:hypothetical protein [Paenibacillus sp. FSL R7-0128]|uniref:hypothetical protein n=1 Tax=Paenibacillus sp. FSL R7-0128 TaxID=2954529 RepID=UPI0030FCB9C2
MNDVIFYYKEYPQKALFLKQRFKITEKTKWTAGTVMQEITVQLGHLATVIFNQKNNPVISKMINEVDRPIVSLEDEISDLYLQIFYLCHIFGIDPLELYLRKLESESSNIVNWSEINYLEVILIVIGQVTESVMKIEGTRFSMERSNIYCGEIGFLQDRLGVLLLITSNLADNYQVNLAKSFDSMEKSAKQFLSLYREQD